MPRFADHFVPVEPNPPSPRSVTSRLGSSWNIVYCSMQGARLKCSMKKCQGFTAWVLGFQIERPGYQGKQCARTPTEQSYRLPSLQNPQRRGWTSQHLFSKLWWGVGWKWVKNLRKWRFSLLAHCQKQNAFNVVYKINNKVTYIPSVIFIHHTRPYVYVVLPGQTRP